MFHREFHPKRKWWCAVEDRERLVEGADHFSLAESSFAFDATLMLYGNVNEDSRDARASAQTKFMTNAKPKKRRDRKDPGTLQRHSREPDMVSIRQRIDTFMADEKARGQYES